MTLTDRIKDSFARQGLLRTLGARVVSVEPGAVTLALPLTEALTQQQGYAHGGVAFSLGDSAAGYAAVSLLEPEFDVVTSDMTIHYLAPGLGDTLEARGTVIRPGRRMLVTQADIYTVAEDKETHIARMTGTMVRVTPSA
ncbi:phenylacetic acid degradation protein [Sagittula sp. P11]|uniref:PaaI family thioesterase n=1 Tax=unclassified Sagittula TaxID=2624628 RepID=UPI000C2CF547|nr:MULTISPECIES: PaaI family thioesterase [unclassified Sagittula]AUC54117.1 phenylacetic acid degradation protein [Sagittula sp. P11]WHZ34513.1 PaaI family thioesterase [Sagittula sp. MA-2]